MKVRKISIIRRIGEGKDAHTAVFTAELSDNDAVNRVYHDLRFVSSTASLGLVVPPERGDSPSNRRNAAAKPFGPMTDEQRIKIHILLRRVKGLETEEKIGRFMSEQYDIVEGQTVSCIQAERIIRELSAE